MTTKRPINFDWVTVPEGEFLMGSDKSRDEGAWDDETPQHTFYLPTYRIARVPVTVAQFAHFVEATGHATTAETQGSASVWTGSEWEDVDSAYWAAPRGPDSDVRAKQDHPVTCVSWHDAVEFCNWAQVRLPSEAEWEKAARGTDGRLYPWGNGSPDKNRCNFNNNVGDTTPVDQYAAGASPYGCLDMAGNVWEWTSTEWLDNYEHYAEKVRNGGGGDARGVVRGGSFNYPRQYVRCASRVWPYPTHRSSGDGFRVVSPGPLASDYEL